MQGDKYKPPKTHRRTKVQISRDFNCPVASCEKSYGTLTSLKSHIRIKHIDLQPDMKSNKTRIRTGRPVRHNTIDDTDSQECPNVLECFAFLLHLVQLEDKNWVRANEDQLSGFNVQELIQSNKTNVSKKVDIDLLWRCLEHGLTIFRDSTIQVLYQKTMVILGKSQAQMTVWERDLLRTVQGKPDQL